MTTAKIAQQTKVDAEGKLKAENKGKNKAQGTQEETRATSEETAEEIALTYLLNDLYQTGQRISHNLEIMNADLKEMVAMARGIR